MHLERLVKVLNIFWKFWNGSEVGNPVDQVTPALISAGALAKGVAVIVSNKLEQIRQRENVQNAKLPTVSHFYCELSARRTVQFSCITDLKTRGSERWSISQQRSGKPKTIECQPLPVQKIFHFKLLMQLELTLSLQSFENWTECDRDKRSKLCFFVLK